MADQAFLQFIDVISDAFDDNPYHAKSLLEELLSWLKQQPKYEKYISKTQAILDAFQHALPSIKLEQHDYALAYKSNFDVIFHISEPLEHVTVQFNGHTFHPTIVDEDRLFFELLFVEPGTYTLDIFQNEQRLAQHPITIKSLIEMDDLGL
jgi:hypothetical protein